MACPAVGLDGKKVTKVGDVELGGLPEGAAFTPDGKYLFVGNYLDQDISILKVNIVRSIFRHIFCPQLVSK